MYPYNYGHVKPYKNKSKIKQSTPYHHIFSGVLEFAVPQWVENCIIYRGIEKLFDVIDQKYCRQEIDYPIAKNNDTQRTRKRMTKTVHR